MKIKFSDNISISLFAKLLANKYQYLTIIFDGEYKHFVVEINDPYGKIIATGLDTTLEEAIDDAIRNIETDGK